MFHDSAHHLSLNESASVRFEMEKGQCLSSVFFYVVVTAAKFSIVASVKCIHPKKWCTG